MHTLPETGFLRLPQIIGDSTAVPPIPPLVPVSKSTWWAGVRSGRYPQPSRGLGARITAWRVEDIRALIEQAGAKPASPTSASTSHKPPDVSQPDVRDRMRRVLSNKKA